MDKKITIALAGNPNAGKSTVFNNLTGSRQHVGNYPGVTVEKKTGKAKHNGVDIQVVDLPGTYSLTAYSLEEVVARNFVLNEKPDVVVDVVDASNLERNLYLTMQFIELNVPLVIALNMFDLATSRNITIDVEKLSEYLGIPIVPMVGTKDKGTKELLDAILKAAETHRRSRAKIRYGEDLEEEITALEALIDVTDFYKDRYPKRWLAIKLLEQDPEIKKLMLSSNAADIKKQLEKSSSHLRYTMDEEPENLIADGRYGYIHGLSREILKQEAVEGHLYISDKVDNILLNRILGPIILLAVLYFTFKFIFWASEIPIGWMESAFDWIAGVFDANMADGLLKSLIISGVIDGVGGVLGFLPLIMIMFFAIAILEATGYMARIAFIMDRIMRNFGLHGSSVLSLIVSGGVAGGCAVPGVMATRTLKDERERLATILVAPLMNCGAKLPVYALLIGAFFAAHQAWLLLILTLLSWSFALLAGKVLRSTVLKGPLAPFVMELPPYRLPTIKGLLIHMWERTWHYIKKAGSIILSFSIILWAMMTFPGLPETEQARFDSLVETAVADQKPQADIDAIEMERAAAKLNHSIAGRVGHGLEAITRPLGFDYRTNVALFGGFAAKELVVSTLGTAYSLGEIGEDDPASLKEELRADPGWNPLTAFALIVFVMLYSPCFATIVVIKKESGSWKWAGFAMLYSTVLAYVAALVIQQAGQLIGLGG